MTFTKRTIFLVILLLSVSLLYSQQKYALVIGNSNYTGISRLNNPVNDANDMEAALRDLGFTVDKVLNGSLTDMENAIIRLKNRLSVTQNSYGFLFYAGHGVQSNGVNYLIPVGESIPSENYLRSRAVSVQAMMDELNDAGNELNIVVLDACRDNPFGWARSGSRGLTVLSNQPANSIIVYATTAGSTAADGTGRNGLFTSHLLNNIKTPGLEITEVFRRTGAAVIQASGSQQVPAVYNQFFGTAYLGSRSEQSAPATTTQPTPTTGVVTPQPLPAGLEYSINAGSVTITRYTGDATTVYIPSQIQGLPVTVIGNDAFYACYRLTSITIPSSVTFIGDYAFCNCSGLINITIPSSVSSIGKRAFFRCSSLTSIMVDSRNTTYTSVDGIMFDKSNKTMITYPAGIKSESYSIPSSVSSIGNWAFSGCTKLTSITIPSSVSSIGGLAFSECTGLTSITVDNRNSTYVNIDGILFDKNIRTIIAYPAGKTAGTYSIPSSVTSIGDGAFCCSNLTNITIPSSVSSIGNEAFISCLRLTNITIPSSVSSIGDEAFSQCAYLTSITIPSSVSSIGDGAFSYCDRLTNITVDSRNLKFTSVEGVLYDKNIRTVIAYPAGIKSNSYSILSSVSSIGNWAFSGCYSLTSIIIPSSVTSIGVWAFSNCSDLTSIIIPSSVTSIGNEAFYYCGRLTSITIPSSVSSIGDGAFYYCSRLTTVSLSRRTRVGQNAFPTSARITYRD